MKKHLIILAAIAALFVPDTAAAAQTCSVPFEWCTLGCPEVGAYSIAGFGSMADADSFIASLSAIQQETVRVAAFPAYGTHVIVAYRVSGSGGGNGSVQVGLDCAPSTVLMRGYAAIETAEAELNQLPIDQRSGAAVIAVPAVSNDPNTRALLIWMRPALGGVQDGSLGIARGQR